MPNIHTSERQPDETQQRYRERQRTSRAVIQTMRKGPTQQRSLNALLDYARFWLGQHTNPKRNAERRALRNAKRAAK